MTVGVPFPKGAPHDPTGVRLENADGPVPAQTEALARWSDGSVKWLLLDFLTDALRPGTNEWLLHPDEGGARSEPGEPLQVTETADAFVVETGTATFHVSRTRLQPFTQARVGGGDVLEPDGSWVRLTGPKGDPVVGKVDESVVEARASARHVAVAGTIHGPIRPAIHGPAFLLRRHGTGAVRPDRA